jgi:RNA-binding protein
MRIQCLPLRLCRVIREEPVLCSVDIQYTRISGRFNFDLLKLGKDYFDAPDTATVLEYCKMALNAATKKRLRAQAHALKPVVMVGQHGYSSAVAAAIDEALTDHELIKVRLRGIEREGRKPIVAEICADLDAESVALVGGVATFFRKRPDN